MPRARQLLWFVGLWVAGVGATAAVAWMIRLWLSSSAASGGS
jgi:hypothetical protein